MVNLKTRGFTQEGQQIQENSNKQDNVRELMEQTEPISSELSQSTEKSVNEELR
jgi:hypothetical protein